MSNPSSSGPVILRLPVLLLLATILWFITLATRPLMEPDEGRYGEIAREMLVTGDWVTPRLNGLKYFEKPPLQYWATAASLKLFGVNEFGSRFWLGLTGFAGILMIGYTGARLFSRTVGVMAAAILGSSLMYVVMGHINTLDMSLSWWFTLMLCGFLLAQHSTLHSPEERFWMWTTWAAAGGAFLTKGLIGFILPGLTLLAYSLVCREWSAWRRLHLLTGLPLLLLICAPWIVVVAHRNPEFLEFFFWHEQFARFLSDAHDRDGPVWYFLPLLVVGTLPWTLVLARQLIHSWRADAASATPFQPRRFMLVWCITVVGFFSLSHSKLAPYIVPIWPTLALLAAERLAHAPTRLLRNHWWLMGTLLLLLGIVIACLPDTVAGARDVGVVQDLRPETSASFVVLGMTLLLTAWRLGHGLSMSSAVIASGLGGLLALTILIQGTAALEGTRSSRIGARAMQPHVSADTRLYSVGDYPQSLPFYLGRTLTLVGYRGELDFGLNQQPHLGLKTLDALKGSWLEPGPAIAVLPNDMLGAVQDLGLKFDIIARQQDWLAIKKQ